MVSHMTTSYKPQTAQMNEELFRKPSLDLTLTQHSHDENLELRKVGLILKLNPFELGIITFFQIVVSW